MGIKTSEIWKVSKEHLLEIVSQSGSMTEVLKHFGMLNKGGNYYTLKKRLEEEGIPLPNGNRDRVWDGKETFFGPTRNFDDILVEDSTYNNTSALKRRLLKAGLVRNECYKCGLGTEWQCEEIVLQLDHINGKPRDHRIENLRMLCPNCHSQTLTYGKKKRN